MRRNSKRKNVVCLSLFRIALASVSLSFFIYFFVANIFALRSGRLAVDTYLTFELQYRVLVDGFVEEQSLLIHHLIRKEYPLRYADALNKTDSRLSSMRHTILSSGTKYKDSVVAMLDQLGDFRASVFNDTRSVVEVLQFYEVLIVELAHVWVSHVSGSIEAVNRVVLQDMYHNIITQDMSMQRDITIAMALFNNTRQDHGILRKYLSQYSKIVTVHVANAFLYGTEELGKFYNSLFTIPSVIFALITFNDMMRIGELNYDDMQQYKANNFTRIGFPQFDFDAFERSFFTFLEAMDRVDNINEDPNFSDLVVTLAVSILGLTFQMIVTISLLWVAIPALITLSDESFLKSHPSVSPDKTTQVVRNE